MSSVQATGSSSDAYAAINAAGSKTSTSASDAASSAEAQQNRFLMLLTTQLKNQDPLNPMDNAQMTSQLAQMSTVSGIEKLNTTVNSLVDSIGTSQSMQASSMLGKNVMVPGTELDLTKSIAFGGINLSGAADQVTVHILDSKGKEIQTEVLGAQKAGILNFAWDGKTAAGATAPDGVYKFSVEAVQSGKSVKADALQIGTVSALVRSSNGFLLDLGALGTVDFKNVQQIL
jgi:flagellar basal-body rod modification protein FlgD